jgi:hypothetical protein
MRSSKNKDKLSPQMASHASRRADSEKRRPAYMHERWLRAVAKLSTTDGGVYRVQFGGGRNGTLRDRMLTKIERPQKRERSLTLA